MSVQLNRFAKLLAHAHEHMVNSNYFMSYYKRITKGPLSPLL